MTSKRISGGFIPSVRWRPLCPSCSMSCCAWRFLPCPKILSAHILGLSLVSKDSISPGFFRVRGLPPRLPFEISRSKTGWSHLTSSCLSNLPMICISMYSYSLSFELLGQLMWLPAREFIGKAHLDLAYARVHLNRSFCSLLPQIAISSMSPWIPNYAGIALASTKDVRDLWPGLEIGWYFADPCDVFRKCHASPRGESPGFRGSQGCQ